MPVPAGPVLPMGRMGATPCATLTYGDGRIGKGLAPPDPPPPKA